MQREGAATAAAAAAAAQMHPDARCYLNILHHSSTEQFASASGAHLQSVFTSSESGTVFTGARTRCTVWCAVLLWLFFFFPSHTGILAQTGALSCLCTSFSERVMIAVNKPSLPAAAAWFSSVPVIASLFFCSLRASFLALGGPQNSLHKLNRTS